MKKECIIELSIALTLIQCIHLIILTVERTVRNPIILGPVPIGLHAAVVLLAALAGIFLAFKASKAEKEEIRLETARRLRREHDESMNETLRLIWNEFQEHLRLISSLAQFNRGDEIKEYVVGLLEDSACGEQETASIKNPIINSLLIGVFTKARQAKAAVKCRIETDLAELHYDRAALMQIFGNILQCAIEAIANDGSSSSHTMTIRIRQLKRHYSFLILVTCSFIPPGRRTQVFEKGFATKADASGLGLYIARQAVLRLEGTIGARGFSKGGTTFLVRLPIAGEA